MEVISDSRSLTIATMLGVVAFISTGMLPTPLDKMLMVVQALTFTLASLIIDEWGGTYAAAVNGVLLSLIRMGFFPFSLVFSVTYGLLIDSFLRVFKVKTANRVKAFRLTCSVTMSTAIIGLTSFYVTTLLGLMPMIPFLYLAILVIGVLNGLVAGYLTFLLWNKYLFRYIKAS